jgi:hypothetical protein
MGRIQGCGPFFSPATQQFTAAERCARDGQRLRLPSPDWDPPDEPPDWDPPDEPPDWEPPDAPLDCLPRSLLPPDDCCDERSPDADCCDDPPEPD